MPLDELVNLSRSRNLELFEQRNLVRDFSNFSFDPTGTTKTSRWERAVATVIHCLSGWSPRREILVSGRQIVERLDWKFKRDHGREFVLTFLPYLLIGAKIHLQEGFSNQGNEIGDALKCVSAMFGQKRLEVVSFLCAHRESSKKAPNSLAERINTHKAERALNLQLGLLANSTVQTGTIAWYQQFPSPRAASNMFPEVFLHYLRTAKVPHLLLQLETHRKQICEIVDVKNHPETHMFQLHSLDGFATSVESFLVSGFGPDWRNGQWPTTAYSSYEQLIAVSKTHAFPEVERCMPYFNNPLKPDENLAILKMRNKQQAIQILESGAQRAEAHSLPILTDEAINWFIENQRMTIQGKALYETAFYYCWGLSARRNQTVGIVLERDYAPHHYHAWKLGYYDGQAGNCEAVPFICLRGFESEFDETNQGLMPFRQFWRFS